MLENRPFVSLLVTHDSLTLEDPKMMVEYRVSSKLSVTQPQLALLAKVNRFPDPWLGLVWTVLKNSQRPFNTLRRILRSLFLTNSQETKEK